MPEIVRVDDKIIGQIEDGVFTKRVRQTHMLRTPRAWGIDCKAFLEQVYHKTKTIRIEELDSGTVYEISTEVFNRRKGYLNRGFGPQYFVALKYWHQIRQGQKALL